MVKQLTSTDEVQAEKKYKDPFHYVPCHTLVLYTNYLPRISGIDDGIWDRLYVIPFNNKLRGGAEDIKNYADFLFENAGEYILKWIIEGAKKVIEAEYKPTMPAVVREAIDSYREQNNWFNHFLEDCCEKDKKAYVSSNQLYAVYRRYSAENNEYTRSTNDFYGTLEKYGFKRGTEKRVRVIYGLRLSVTNEIDEDFLT
jgi:P4 family phage/plasmid primase-like protien